MAANDRILVDTPEMTATIQKYESARGTLQEAYGKLESAKDHLDNCYKGPAWAALCVKWADIYANVRTAENGIDESVNGLRKTIIEMNRAQNEINKNIDALDEGTSAPTYL